MENKTAEDFELPTFASVDAKEKHTLSPIERFVWNNEPFNSIPFRKDAKEALIYYASLQCAEMKKENENLQGSLIKAQKENWLLSVRIKELERVIHMANQMLISYDMRHPEDEDCLVGRSNSEAKEIIEKTLNHDTINKP